VYVKLFTDAIIIRKKWFIVNLYFVLKIEQKLKSLIFNTSDKHK